MIRSNLCDYSDANTFVIGTIIIKGADDAAKQAAEINKGVIFQNCAPFAECISNINNARIDNAKDVDVVMPMYNLIGYSDNYSKTSESLWQFYGDDLNQIYQNLNHSITRSK